MSRPWNRRLNRSAVAVELEEGEGWEVLRYVPNHNEEKWCPLGVFSKEDADLLVHLLRKDISK